MWLTLHFSWSVYLCVYIYAHPPHGPCPASPHEACNTHTGIMQRMWTGVMHTHPHDTWKLLHFQWLTDKGKLLCNQLPCFSMKKTGEFSRQGCVAEPMHIFNPTLWVDCPTLDNENKQWTSLMSFAHELRYRRYLQSHVKRRRQRITRGSNHLLYLSMLQIVYYLSL